VRRILGTGSEAEKFLRWYEAGRSVRDIVARMKEMRNGCSNEIGELRRERKIGRSQYGCQYNIKNIY
jgi:hypothetical protein